VYVAIISLFFMISYKVTTRDLCRSYTLESTEKNTTIHQTSCKTRTETKKWTKCQNKNKETDLITNTNSLYNNPNFLASCNSKLYPIVWIIIQK